ncbi:hypothetical protein ACFE04_016229 [Oxalis oulophora]
MTGFNSSIVDNLLMKLATVGYNEISSAWGVKTDGLHLWLNKLKDVCYDAEDVVDLFEAYKERDDRSVVLEGRETHSFLELDEVIGRDQHKHDLVKILLSSTNTSNPSVIPILQHQLRALLKYQRYLIMLDDVWNKDSTNWNDLKYLLMGGASGSRVIFIKGAFGDGNEREHPNLSKIAKEIEKNLNRDDSLIAVLKLSYDNLPSPMKSCFIYCSLFPKDYMFFSVELIQCWMANGFLESHQQNEELEDVGFMYLMDLWSKSFFQNFEDYGTAVGFKLHDIMHDLAISIANEECVFVDERRLQNSKNARHLVISNVSIIEQEKNTFTMLGNMKNITRTFICPGLGTYNERIKKLPNSICKLNSLQFLDIGGCSELVETLKDMKYMISLRFLRFTTKHKSLSGMECPHTLQTLVIFNFPSLKSLPCGLKCLASLKTLWIHNCEELDLGIKCKNEDDHQDVVSFLSLQKLMIARLPKLINLPSWLLQGSLNSLETILIEYCENLTELPESLLSITTLNELSLIYRWKKNDEDQPCGLKLKKLAIVGLPKLMAVPRWLLQGSILSLETIWIVDCPQLKTLHAVIQSLTSLNSLYIVDCPQLIDRCEIGAGEDFHKIAYV